VNGRPDFGNRTLLPGFAQIYEYSSHGGQAFHAGTATANLRRSAYFLSASYTVSKLIDDVLARSFENTAENVYDPRRDRAKSEFDTRQALDVIGNWDFPSSQRYANNAAFRFINHVSLFGDFHYNSGRYFNVLAGSDLNHDGNPLTDRPLSVGRNTFLGQEFAQLDLGLSFKVPFREEKAFAFSLECFNVLNRANFTNFQTVLGQGDLTGVDPRIIFGRGGISDLNFRQPLAANGFGLATSAATPRRIQLRLNFSF